MAVRKLSRKRIYDELSNIEAGDVVDGAITTGKLADGALAASTAGRLKMADAFFSTEAVFDAKVSTGIVDADRLKNASITSAQLAAGALSADTAGRAVMATSYFDTEATVDSKFATNIIDGDRLKAAGVGDDRLTSKLAKDIGAAGAGWVYFSGSVSDTDTVTINGRVYEFDTNSSITGNVAVDVSGGATAPEAVTALVAAINADASRDADTKDLGGNVVGMVGKVVATNPTLAKSGANITVGAAAFVGGSAAAVKSLARGEYTVTAADVTNLAISGNEVVVGCSPSATAPTLHSLGLRTSGDVLKSLATVGVRVTQLNTNFWGVVVLDAGAVLASDDKLSWLSLF